MLPEPLRAEQWLRRIWCAGWNARKTRRDGKKRMISPTSSLKYQSYDRRFDALFGVEAELKRLWSGGGWLEGRVWLPSEGQVLFSDIPNDRQFLYNSHGGRMLEHQAGHHRYANGAALCGNGDILVCEHGTRALTRTRPDGTRSIVMDHYQGARLNSPNDVVVTSDGTIWFTDPSYGIESDTHGRKAPREQSGNFVFQLLPNGEQGQVLKDFAYPNGIAVSDDNKWLYVADSGGSRSPGNERHIRRYPLRDGRAGRSWEGVCSVPQWSVRRLRLRRRRAYLGKRVRWRLRIRHGRTALGVHTLARMCLQPVLWWTRQPAALRHCNKQHLPDQLGLEGHSDENPADKVRSRRALSRTR